MSDKVKLLEVANKKAASDIGFVAYFISRYIEIEQTNENKIIESLKCTIENYYKLGLCNAPNVNSADYLQRLNNISDYIGVSTIELNKIIKRVHSVTQFYDNKNSSQSYLMAARDKKKKDK